jgi:hypothetical protein
MCNFLLVGIPKGASIHIANERSADNLRLISIDAGILPATFPGDMQAFFLVSGGCSCDLFSRTTGNVDEREVTYRRKGWSEQKIQRALAQAKHAVERHAEPGFRPDVRSLLTEWVGRFQTIALAYFATRADPTDDIPTALSKAAIVDVVRADFEPPPSSILIVSS